MNTYCEHCGGPGNGKECEYCGPKWGNLNRPSPDLHIPEQPHGTAQVIAEGHVREGMLLIAVQIVWMLALTIDMWLGLVRKIHYGGIVAALRAVYLIGLVYQTNFYVKYKFGRATVLISAIGAISSAMLLGLALFF